MLLNKADRVDDTSRRNSLGNLKKIFDLTFCWENDRTILKDSKLLGRVFSSQFVRVMLAEVQNSSDLSNVVIIQRLLFWIIADQHACIFHLLAYRPQRIHVHQLWSRQMLMVDWEIGRRRIVYWGHSHWSCYRVRRWKFWPLSVDSRCGDESRSVLRHPDLRFLTIENDWLQQTFVELQ